MADAPPISNKGKLVTAEMNAMQSKMAHVALSLTVRQAADLTGVSHNTITRFGAGEDLKASTVEKMRSALEAAGVEFIPENGGGAGVRLRKSSGEASV